MKLEINLSTVLSGIMVALCMWLGETVYELDKDVELLEYQQQQTNRVLQELSE